MEKKKVIFITGGASGIGLATAKKLLGEGYIVYATVHENGEPEELKKLGGVPVDIEMEDEKSMKAAVKKVIHEQGRIDVLFNNAGYGHYGPVEEIPLSTAKKLFEVNLFGLARLTQLVLPHMRAAGSGTIINTSSIGGKIYFPLGAWYHASKHAIEGWTDCLRLEVEHLGIRVIIIEPGIIDTGFNEKMIGRIADLKSTGAYEDIKKAMLKTNHSGDPGSHPRVIAELVSKALKAKNPRTRYYGGRLAWLVLFVRRHFSDRFFDRFVMSRLKRFIKVNS